ncbi:GTPase subunit of restriction endonuclease [Acidianus hospitalis W1]|uniref:GTPase subunit of restriction endonuclease n=1 Tax=Acidianus hospitalis (strain W1) TaxID=933801 RepID=F4B6U1_ACIHW|nr:AAA family ATPase [Acidianus hospitalis]AEE94634.1 GTPase subunit of restriction endonuclease [Acidianus hospitalis W1]
MYGEWLTVRPQFAKLFDDSSEDEFISYIKADKFIPCIFVGDKNNWKASIEYSIKGELGYILWGSYDETSYKGIWDRYNYAYIIKNISSNNNLLPNANKILLTLFWMSKGNNKNENYGVIGIGILSDINIDVTRAFKGWSETTSRYWIVRYRAKVIWLHRKVRESIKTSQGLEIDNNLWDGDKIGNISVRNNICYKDENSIKNAREEIKKFIDRIKDEIPETYKFYKNFDSSRNITSQVIEEQSKEILCNRRQKMDLSNFFLPGNNASNLGLLLTKAIEKSNIMFIGPPGVGKTKLAIELARSLSGNNECLNIVTANSLWFRRNLIGGESIREGSVIWKSGLLIQAYVKASRIKEGNYYVIIDEINRADVDKAFGELFTIFSSGDPKDWFIPKALIDEIKSYGDNIDQYAKEFLKIYEELQKQGKENEPLKKIRIISTMNLTDARNLFYVGDALARRFVGFYFDYPKSTEDLDMFLKNYNLGREEKEEIRNLVSYLREKLDKDKLVKFNISPASLKSALEIYSSLENRNIDTFILILKSTLGTLNQDKIEKVEKLIDEWRKEKKQ